MGRMRGKRKRGSWTEHGELGEVRLGMTVVQKVGLHWNHLWGDTRKKKNGKPQTAKKVAQNVG